MSGSRTLVNKGLKRFFMASKLIFRPLLNPLMHWFSIVKLTKINCNFSSKNKIEFRDPSNWSTILHTHKEAQHSLIEMCAAPSALLYLDQSKTPREVHWLHLNDAQPKPGKSVIHTQQFHIRDICFVKDGDKQLLVVAAAQNGLFAYNIEFDKLEWKFDGNIPGPGEKMFVSGVTTDGRGHLFVSDSNNNSIQMFSVLDGQYLGCLTKRMRDLGQPFRVYWCKKASSLVCACWKGQKYHVNVLNVQFQSAC